jgi:hypothetical protein
MPHVEIFSAIDLPNVFPYLCAVLALLLVWQYHEKLVLAGQIQAIDIFDRSGVRMYLSATPDDEQICNSCRAAHGRVFLTSTVARKNFTPLRGRCTNSPECTSVLVGLYGAWPEARVVVQRLRASTVSSIQLSPEEVRGMLNGQWGRSVSAESDRLAVTMLYALSYEKLNPETAIADYRAVIDQAKEVRHLPLLVPAYLRVTELLARHGRVPEALEVIEQFEKRYARDRIGQYFPKDTQRGLMAIMKSRLSVLGSAKKAAPAAPASPPGLAADAPASG